MVPRGKIDLAEGLLFNQVIGLSDGSPCDRTNCTMKDVSLLGKKYDIDISGNSSNDKKLPVNPRVKTGGVNGNLQFTFSDPVLEEAQNFTDMKIVLESITYN